MNEIETSKPIGTETPDDPTKNPEPSSKKRTMNRADKRKAFEKAKHAAAVKKRKNHERQVKIAERRARRAKHKTGEVVAGGIPLVAEVPQETDGSPELLGGVQGSLAESE